MTNYFQAFVDSVVCMTADFGVEFFLGDVPNLSVWEALAQTSVGTDTTGIMFEPVGTPAHLQAARVPSGTAQPQSSIFSSYAWCGLGCCILCTTLRLILASNCPTSRIAWVVCVRRLYNSACAHLFHVRVLVLVVKNRVRQFFRL